MISIWFHLISLDFNLISIDFTLISLGFLTVQRENGITVKREKGKAPGPKVKRESDTTLFWAAIWLGKGTARTHARHETISRFGLTPQPPTGSSQRRMVFVFLALLHRSNPAPISDHIGPPQEVDYTVPCQAAWVMKAVAVRPAGRRPEHPKPAQTEKA